MRPKLSRRRKATASSKGRESERWYFFSYLSIDLPTPIEYVFRYKFALSNIAFFNKKTTNNTLLEIKNGFNKKINL
jgi:hypothetical protein